MTFVLLVFVVHTCKFLYSKEIGRRCSSLSLW